VSEGWTPGTTLTGRVIDPSGRAVPSAEIIVRNLATLLEHSVTTNNEGIYEIPRYRSARTVCK
jgi:Carboxypeptidase regulatory-like domain